MFFVHLLLLLAVQSLSEEQWRLVYQNGHVAEARGELRIGAQEASGLRYAWAWSALEAPRRVEPSELGERTPPASSGRLAIRVHRRGPARASCSGLSVIAAPAAMWDDLPESALPRWPIPSRCQLSIPFDPAQPWRVRAAGQGEGTWWTEVPPGARTVSLSPLPAADLVVQVASAKGEPLPVEAVLSEGTPRPRESRVWARLRSESGRLSVPALPDSEPITFAVLHPEHRPALLRGRVPDLPSRLTLESGASLSGRLLSPQRKPVSQARIALEAWAASQGLQRVTVRGESGKDGRWSLQGIPAGPAALTVEAPGFATSRQLVEMTAGGMDLGDIVLETGRQLSILVVDDDGTPVPGAKAQAGAGVQGTTDRRGIALLSGLADAPAEVRVSAGRHLEGKARVNPPFPPQVRVELRRAFVLTGRLVDLAGSPVGEGTVRVSQPSCFRDEGLEEDGRFQLDLEPASAVELAFRSPGTRELRLAPSPGEAGEVRDLGDLVASTGLVVTGRIVDAADAPIPGARVWLPRPGPDGPALAWAQGDLLQAATGPTGRFRLAGLSPGTALLRAEAAGLARAHRQITLDEGQGELDLGDIRLSPGARLTVLADAEPAEEAVARVDLQGHWQEPDLLTASLRDGTAVFRNVPPGNATVSVIAGRSLLCERKVEVGLGGEQSVDCGDGGMLVTGAVLVGGAPAGPGTLIWRRAAPGAMPAMIDTTTTLAGLRRQETYGLGRPQEDVPVAADGAFQTDRLTPGPWQASWMSASGSVSAAKEVVLPDVDSFQATLSFPGQAVSGVVLDEEDRPVPGARVRELTGGGLAFSQADGTFSLTSLEAQQKVVLQASLEERTSPAVERLLQPGEGGEPVILKLGEEARPEIEVLVLGPDGRPAPNAFVFLEEAGRGVRILTTGNDGRAAATFSPPLPPQVRLGATSGVAWAFGSWVGWDQARSGSTLQLAPGGSLTVTAEAGDGPLDVVAAGGWSVSNLLLQLGSPAQAGPDRPFQIGGLPAGIYTVSRGGQTVSVEVREGEASRAELE